MSRLTHLNLYVSTTCPHYHFTDLYMSGRKRKHSDVVVPKGLVATRVNQYHDALTKQHVITVLKSIGLTDHLTRTSNSSSTASPEKTYTVDFPKLHHEIHALLYQLKHGNEDVVSKVKRNFHLDFSNVALVGRNRALASDEVAIQFQAE
jgi:hypothetical protein